MPSRYSGRQAGPDERSGLARQLAGEGQHGHVAGALDGFGHEALVPGAGAGLAAGADLAAVRHERAQQIDVLVIDGFVLFGAELADPDAACSASPAIVTFFFAAFFISASRPAFLFHGVFTPVAVPRTTLG